MAHWRCGRSWELWWLMGEVVVHKSCGGSWELVWLIGVIVLIPIRFESAIFHSDPVAL